MLPQACLNCRALLGQPRPRFCGQCGQETTLKPPTLLHFAQQFSGAYLSTEGALWRTLGLLLVQPGELTKRYLEGQRKHYVLPLRLYLTISVIVLLMLRAMTNLNIEGAGTDTGGQAIDQQPTFGRPDLDLAETVALWQMHPLREAEAEF